LPLKMSRPRSTLALRFTPGCETDDSAEAGLSDSGGSDMPSQAVSRMPKPFNQLFLFILVFLVFLVCLVYFVCLVCLVNQINQLISAVRNRYCRDLPE
jgi:hypothetical protein